MDRFDLWEYTENDNCWEFVRQYLLDHTDIPKGHLPKFGILPTDKKGMTSASETINTLFPVSKPVNYAIACRYIGKYLNHVGVVYNGRVRHVNEKTGNRNDKISVFETLGRTEYRLHKSLWPH